MHRKNRRDLIGVRYGSGSRSPNVGGQCVLFVYFFRLYSQVRSCVSFLNSAEHNRLSQELPTSQKKVKTFSDEQVDYISFSTSNQYFLLGYKSTYLRRRHDGTYVVADIN